MSDLSRTCRSTWGRTHAGHRAGMCWMWTCHSAASRSRGWPCSTCGHGRNTPSSSVPSPSPPPRKGATTGRRVRWSTSAPCRQVWGAGGAWGAHGGLRLGLMSPHLPSPDSATGCHLHVQLLVPHRGALEATHAAQWQHHLLPGAVAAAGRGHGALHQRLLPQRCRRATRDGAGMGTSPGCLGTGMGMEMQHCPLPPPGLKLPTSSADTRFSYGDGPEVEQDAEERCCPCSPADGQLRMEGEAESFQKKFENFLHNSIIIPRCRRFLGTGFEGSPSIALPLGGSPSASLTHFPLSQATLEGDIHQQVPTAVSWEQPQSPEALPHPIAREAPTRPDPKPPPIPAGAQSAAETWQPSHPPPMPPQWSHHPRATLEPNPNPTSRSLRTKWCGTAWCCRGCGTSQSTASTSMRATTLRTPWAAARPLSSSPGPCLSVRAMAEGCWCFWEGVSTGLVESQSC